MNHEVHCTMEHPPNPKTFATLSLNLDGATYVAVFVSAKSVQAAPGALSSHAIQESLRPHTAEVRGPCDYLRTRSSRPHEGTPTNPSQRQLA